MSTIHGVRGLQPLRWPEGYPGVAVQPPRGGRAIPGPRESQIPAQPLEITLQAEDHTSGRSSAIDRGKATCTDGRVEAVVSYGRMRRATSTAVQVLPSRLSARTPL